MAQITVTMTEIQHRDQRRHIFPEPIVMPIGLGANYFITPKGTGATILDTITSTEYTVSESSAEIIDLIGAEDNIKFSDGENGSIEVTEESPFPVEDSEALAHLKTLNEMVEQQMITNKMLKKIYSVE